MRRAPDSLVVNKGFMSMSNRTFVGLLMMGSSPTSVPGCFGDKGVCSVGRRQWFFFLGGWSLGDGKRRLRDPWRSSYFRFMSRLQTDRYVFMFCIVCVGVDQNPARVEWVTGH